MRLPESIIQEFGDKKFKDLWVEFAGFIKTLPCFATGSVHQERDAHHVNKGMIDTNKRLLGRRSGLANIAMIPLIKEEHTGTNGVDSNSDWWSKFADGTKGAAVAFYLLVFLLHKIMQFEKKIKEQGLRIDNLVETIEELEHELNGIEQEAIEESTLI